MKKYLFYGLSGLFCLFGDSVFAASNSQFLLAENEGVWESTKGVAGDVWDGTKEVGSDVWNGAKEVSSDVWDGTKNVAGDIKNGITGDTPAKPATPEAKPISDSAKQNSADMPLHNHDTMTHDN